MIAYMKHISVTTRCAIQYRNQRLSDSGLNGYQCPYILNICRNPGISQDKLARIIYINKSNVTRQLAVLEENGFVERRPSDADKRAVEVYPTQKAFDILPKVLQVLGEWNGYITEDLTDEEKETLLALLERISEKAKLYADGIDRIEKTDKEKSL